MLVIAVLTSYICIDVLGYGFAAAAVGVTVANWVLFVGLVIYFVHLHKSCAHS